MSGDALSMLDRLLVVTNKQLKHAELSGETTGTDLARLVKAVGDILSLKNAYSVDDSDFQFDDMLAAVVLWLTELSQAEREVAWREISTLDCITQKLGNGLTTVSSETAG